ncbi:MAG TPA: hypothetical protein VF765_32625 [Polyangiaceae bacterium]
MKRVAAALALLGGLASASTARAQTSAADKATAQALYDEGKRLMDAGQFAQACPKFADSEKLDPGVGTLLNLGVCYEKNGQTASAWATYKDAASAAANAGEAAREKYARDHAAALEPSLAKLTVAVATPVEGLQVRRDGEAIPTASFGLALPIDPGDHTVTASAPHYKPWSATVTVAKSATASVQIPALEPAPEPTPAPPPVAPPAPTPGQQPQTGTPAQPQTVIIYQGEPQRRGGAQRFWGIFSIATGVVAMGTGTVFGFIAKSQWNKSNNGSDNNGAPDCINDVCTQDGIQRRQDGQTIANIAQWVFVGGAVVAAGGIVLLVTAPSGYEMPPRAALTLSPTLGGAMLRGTW